MPWFCHGSAWFYDDCTCHDPIAKTKLVYVQNFCPMFDLCQLDVVVIVYQISAHVDLEEEHLRKYMSNVGHVLYQ